MHQIDRRTFLAGAASAMVVPPWGDAAAATDLPDWLGPKIDAALKRFTAWKGADETVVFPIMTDLHDWHPDIDPKFGPTKSAKMHIPYALHVGDVFNADFVADLGDMGSDIYWDDAGKMHGATYEIQQRRWKSQFDLYDKTKKPVFCCVGNHDLDYRKPDGKGTTVEPKEFGAFFAPLAHGADVVWGEGKDYCYWDVPGKNLRLINIDTFEWRHSYGLKPAQLAFLAKALQVPENFTVMVIMHAQLAPAFGTWLHSGEMHYRNYCNGIFAKMGVREAMRMFEDYLAHGKGEVNGVKWDFSGLKKNRLAGLLGGHSHYDNTFRQYDVLHIVRQGNGSLSTKTEMPHENGARHHEVFLQCKDTCIDVVAVKPKTGELAIFRIGAGDEKADLGGKKE